MNDSIPNTYMVKSICCSTNDGSGTLEIQSYRKIQPTDKVKDCLKCGLCCKSAFIEIDKPDDCDIALEHREFDELRGRLRVKLASNGYCPYYDTSNGKCKIYTGKRPTVCEKLKRGDIIDCYENQSL